MTDPFDREVESWFDRLERAFTDTDGEGDEAAHDKSDSPATNGSNGSPPSDLERRLQDQAASLASPSSSPASTEPLIELLKEVSAEIRGLRQEVAQARESTEETRRLRRDVDQVKAVLLRLRQLAQARRKSPR